MYKKPLILGVAILALIMNSLAPLHAKVKPPEAGLPMHAARVLTPAYMMQHKVTPAMRIAAAKRAEAKGLRRPSLSKGPLKPNALNPNAPPDYFGAVPNYANSPLPQVDPTTQGSSRVPAYGSSSTRCRASARPTRTISATTSRSRHPTRRPTPALTTT